MRTPRHAPTRAALAALLLLSGSRHARADVVGDPPPDCPAGSVGSVCHGGPFCRPVTCTADAECSDGGTCQDVMACIGGIQCGGLEGGGDPPIDTFEGVCDKGACTGKSVCTAIKQCLPAGDPTTGGTATGGSGSATGGATTGSSPTGGATSSATGTGEAAGDGTGGGDKAGCACATTDGPGLAPLLAPGLLSLRRRRTDGRRLSPRSANAVVGPPRRG